MSVRRPMGIETEFGVFDHANPAANPVVLSTEVVDAYAARGCATGGAGGVNWDYHGEDPLNDARGYRIDRASAHPSQLTDNPEALAPSGDDGAARASALGGGFEKVARPTEYEQKAFRAANAVLTNGARLYVDHAHPEYSSPEVMNPREAILWDRAGELIAQEAMALLAEAGRDVVLYKNNVDGKGASYGCHDNYLVSRDVDFSDIIRYLTPFFVTRPLMCGAGRIGLGARSEKAGFQISQRADYVENDVGLETTFNRPIINTRDEPHADPTRWRRLHVIGGDANLFDVPNLLKVGTTSLLLWLLENDRPGLDLDALLLYEPVRATWAVSHRPFDGVEMHDGSLRTARDIQQIYLDVIREAIERHGIDDFDTWEILTLWQQVLDLLGGSDQSAAAPYVEWVAKYQLANAIRQRDGASWDNDRLRALDVQWHDLRPSKSLVAKLDAAGRVQRIMSREHVEWAVRHAPESTRAYLRGRLIAEWPQSVARAGWDGITLDIPGYDHLIRLPLMDPERGTKADVGHALDTARSIEDVVASLL